MNPELQAFSTAMMIYAFLIMDEWLFHANVERYIQMFGLDLNWAEVSSGFFIFWRLVDYDNRNIR